MVRLLRRRKLVAALAASAVMVCMAAAWLAFQYIPRWYHQPVLSRSASPDLQVRLEETFEQVSQLMARGETFTLSFSARQLNDILAAQPRLWPAAAQWLGQGLQHPCVRILDERLDVGIRWRWGELKSILNVSVGLGIDGHALFAELHGAGAGVLPLPAVWLISHLDRPYDDLRLEGARVLVPNEFNWPNGDIPFVLRGIELADERLTLTIEPYGY